MYLRLIIISCLLIMSNVDIAAQESAPKAGVETHAASLNQAYLKSASKRIASLLARSHYSTPKFDDQLSSKAFERLFDALDPNKTYFTSTDIEALALYRHEFVGMVASVKFELADAMLNKMLAIMDARLNTVLTKIEAIPTKTVLASELSFPAKRLKTDDALQLFWNKRLKQEAAYLALDGLNHIQIKTALSEQYKQMRQKWQTLDAEDKFSFLINAFIQAHDIDSKYLTTKAATQGISLAKGQNAGRVGVTLAVESAKVVVTVSGDAATQAGITVGAQVLAIKRNEQWLYANADNINELSEWLNLGSDDSVTFKLLRGRLSSFSVEIATVKRLAHQKQVVEAQYIGPGGTTALLKIPSFYNELSKDLAMVLQGVKAKNINRLILDLRGNGGGALGEAIASAGLFIGKGPIIQIRKASGKVAAEGITDGSVWFKGALVLLVDEMSAGGTEIFVAAIQDYGVGIVVGQPTYGRGTIQQHRGLGRIYDLYEKGMGSIQYTIAEFFRINGKGFQLTGVQPDIVTKWTDKKVNRSPRALLIESGIGALKYRSVRTIKPLVDKLPQPVDEVSDLDYVVKLTAKLAALLK